MEQNNSSPYPATPIATSRSQTDTNNAPPNIAGPHQPPYTNNDDDSSDSAKTIASVHSTFSRMSGRHRTSQ
ncbi:9952_t:CDS:1, partial [Ambispora leptoticha]